MSVPAAVGVREEEFVELGGLLERQVCHEVLPHLPQLVLPLGAVVGPAADAGERRRERHPDEPGAVAPARRKAEGGDGHAPRGLAVGGVPVLAAGLVLGLPQAHEEPRQALQLLLAALLPRRGVLVKGVPGLLVLLGGSSIDFKNHPKNRPKMAPKLFLKMTYV